ncbi:hypothetical protein CCY99_06185 [Helicobacter sp. 16-1353]|uniref:murein hydrolase activator EnvC family protein n=1 Tax=Helicobacter sp. 16-1353 TaxID=2004996 RepID=UPI000DCD9E7B|nr:peptidoglycan DD-metalloendopeptidase family protein [Helicobacter sp. 16-1353]RAX53179.1 hypothetical protein CCY99_06185 [Helicobacter sp. 16-1353]
MRLIILLFSFTLLFANTDKSIKANQQKLQNISSQQSAINKKLKTLGANINDKNAKIKELDKQIRLIQKNIDTNQKVYLEQEKVYTDLQSKLNELTNRLETLQNNLVDTILKDMTIAMILNSKEALSEDSIINEEILKQMSNVAKQHINNIIKEQEATTKEMKDIKDGIDSAKKVITSQKEKKEILEIARKEQQNLAKKLNIELDSYNDELKQLDKERVGIQEILVSLNILKKQELENQEQKREKLLKSEPAKTSNEAPLEVRQIGSSYRNVSTAKYRGSKTIAPLKNYKIETKYGPYFDPVYKMRVFNEFITFSVNKRSPVLSVLDGKIVFAKDTAMLKKVVIIEHKNGIHTIYSYLDEILGTTKVGSNIKKGATIAYVNDKLNFEVTQKDKHINPLDFIVAK